ncbi:hypothetical protein BSLG_009850 [Batrachochytrium salamandrivorans]|nr:hypothetical protein BSLG_009850 [Batrachochytrium salamandrivorans]
MASAMVNMEEYFRVNVERKLFIKVPEQEDHDLTPATRLLERRREMLEVETGLQKQKEEFSMKMESLTQRREELARKESQLKDSLLKFDKFLKENDAKRMRALKKSMDERKLREQKELEIGVLKSSITDLGDRKDRQGNAVDIIERARTAQERTEKDRQAFLSSSEVNTQISRNNEVARLQTKLEEVQIKSAKWQAELDQMIKNATQKSLLLGQGHKQPIQYCQAAPRQPSQLDTRCVGTAR